MSLLEIDDLQVSFCSEAGAVRAVNGISLSLDAGSTLGVVGESGCGKSVTMLSVMRLLSPSAVINRGRVLYKGRDLLTASEAEMRDIRGAGIAMVFQDPMTSLNPVITVGEQIAEAVRAHRKVSRHDAWALAVKAMEMVRIPASAERAGDYPHRFSGGMRQRIMIAMAISCRPEILIADEPSTALDVTVQAQILALFADIQRQTGMSIILITHDLRVAAQVCDRMAVFYAGRVIETGDADDIISRPCHPYTRGLLASLPGPAGAMERLPTIGGHPPNLIDSLPGCSFAARCPQALDLCRQAEPETREVDEGRRVACHLCDRGREGYANE